VSERWAIACDPRPFFLFGRAGTIGLIPFEVFHAWDIVRPKMSHQFFPQPMAADKKNVLILIPQNVHAVAGRHGV